MKPLLLLLPLLLAFAQGLEPKPTPEPPTTIPLVQTSSVVPETSTVTVTTPNNTTPNTTISPNTTPSTITTPKPMTTTPKPMTTTPKATTTTAPDTTTPATTTTTTPSPSTTTVAPPSNQVGNWSVIDNGIICVQLQMNLRVEVVLSKEKNATKMEVNLPTDKQAVATGVCGKLEQNITITWPLGNSTFDNLTIHFVKNAKEPSYTMHHMELWLLAPNATSPVMLIHNHSDFSTGLDSSYRCLKRLTLPLKIAGKNETVGNATVTELQFQAFKTDSSAFFGKAKDCSFDTPDIVPIVVGCALATLVVIVLVAYLVGRRRSHSQGYVSM